MSQDFDPVDTTPPTPTGGALNKQTPQPPRGVQVIKKKNKDRTESIFYRVQIKTKTFKEDKLFESLEEATEFRNASKSATGKRKINLIKISYEEQQKVIHDYIENPPFHTYIKDYIEKYIQPKYADLKLNQPEDKIKYRQYKTMLSFFKTIKETKIRPTPKLDIKMNALFFQGTQPYIKFGDLKPVDITEIEINEYIKERMKTIKPISIQREITCISNVFRKLKYLDQRLKTIDNPALKYDRDLLLLKGRIVKNSARRLSNSDKTKLIEELQNYSNIELGQIILLSMYTALRRSEVILLKWSNIFETHIELKNTKTEESRVIYLTAEAKELLKTIEKKPNQDRLFTYEVLGFAGSYKKFLEERNLKHLKFHTYRKEAISNMIERAGKENSLLIAEILGISNVRRLEESHIKQHIEEQTTPTQAQILKQIGHKNSNTTKKHYFTLKKEDWHKIKAYVYWTTQKLF